MTDPSLGTWADSHRPPTRSASIFRPKAVALALVSATSTANRSVPPGAGRPVRSVRHLGVMSRFVEDIRWAMARGDLPHRFRPSDVRRACPGWADHTYGVFLPKHRRGNPGGYTEYFLQNPDGSYSLIR
jgi:hypothetical protein